MNAAEWDQAIAEAVAAAPRGRASAAKRGRRAEWPYVPVVIRTDDVGVERSGQVLGVAFATREEAVAAAQASIDAAGESLARKLGQRQHRALREAHGLPRELDR